MQIAPPPSMDRVGTIMGGMAIDVKYFGNDQSNG
jgi:hypothetical protein